MTLEYILGKNNNFSKLSKKRLVAIISFLLAAFLKLRIELNEHKKHDVNLAANKPSSKQAEFDNPPKKPKNKKRKKRKLRKKNKGSGNVRKNDLTPDRINKTALSNCPICDCDLSKNVGSDTRGRIVEDMKTFPEKTEVTEEICECKWCPNCKVMVSSKSEAALPGCDIGLRATVVMAYLWVVIAITLPNIVKILSQFFRLTISPAGISRLMIRVANIMMPVYEEILEDVRKGAIIHADETGWKVCGVLWWLWAFANRTSAFYWPDRCRGSPVVAKILGSFFTGVLVTDAWCAYMKIICIKQTCTSHLTRKIRAFRDAYPQYPSLIRFYKIFRRILLDGETLRKLRKNFGEVLFAHRLQLLKNRLNELLVWENPNDILATVIKKIKAQEDKILVFVSFDGVDQHNNFGEYIIRKGVLKRKMSGGSMSYDGLFAYSLLISIGQTCHLRGLSFMGFLYASLVHYIKKGRPMLLAEYAGQKEQYSNFNQKAA